MGGEAATMTMEGRNIVDLDRGHALEHRIKVLARPKEKTEFHEMHPRPLSEASISSEWLPRALWLPHFSSKKTSIAILLLVIRLLASYMNKRSFMLSYQAVMVNMTGYSTSCGTHTCTWLAKHEKIPQPSLSVSTFPCFVMKLRKTFPAYFCRSKSMIRNKRDGKRYKRILRSRHSFGYFARHYRSYSGRIL